MISFADLKWILCVARFQAQSFRTHFRRFCPRSDEKKRAEDEAEKVEIVQLRETVEKDKDEIRQLQIQVSNLQRAQCSLRSGFGCWSPS